MAVKLKLSTFECDMCGSSVPLGVGVRSKKHPGKWFCGTTCAVGYLSPAKKKLKKAEAWEHVCFVGDHEIRRHKASGRIGCGCGSYRFNKGGKFCKHTDLYYDNTWWAWSKNEAPGTSEQVNRAFTDQMNMRKEKEKDPKPKVKAKPPIKTRTCHHCEKIGVPSSMIFSDGWFCDDMCRLAFLADAQSPKPKISNTTKVPLSVLQAWGASGLTLDEMVILVKEQGAKALVDVLDFPADVPAADVEFIRCFDED